MKQTKTKKGIHVNWVGVFIFTFIAFLTYCASWIYVLDQESDKIESRLLENELIGKDNFKIEENEINNN